MISRSLCSLDASGDTDNTVLYSRCPPYGSSRTARYLDADNSFSILPVPLFFLLLCPVHCYFSCLLLFRVFLLLSFFFIYLFSSSSAKKRPFRSLLRRLHTRFRREACACVRMHACTRMCACVLLPWTTGILSFALSFLLYLSSAPQLTTLHGWHVRDFLFSSVGTSSFLPSVTVYLRSSALDRTHIINVEMCLCGISRNAMKIPPQIANFFK